MRIRSLEAWALHRRPAVVIAQVEEFKVDLSAFESGSSFYRSIPEAIPAGLPLVVVNPTVEILEEFQTRTFWNEASEIQLWVNAAGLQDFAECLSKFDEFALCGTSLDETWLRALLGPSASSDRLAEDFITGIQTGSLRRSTESFEVEVSPQKSKAKPSVRAELIRITASALKPVKPYLPTRLVHTLYKILGALR
ncbi:hypothetical protein [Corynebacterium sp. HMSC29G08]|uniref:hypothetical protein n=1 Tax=Corynebacterium sp. HMSC29G08 TaxID=1581069 RepID=UPI0008A38201|nr:hypothetical protein [Corynebacterium sp. HMSC29G08]